MAWSTHEVTNQVPDLIDYNLFRVDTALQEAVMREGAQDAVPALLEYGRVLGQARIIASAAEIDRQSPRLEQYDRQGHRADDVVFHPGWHEFLELGVGQGLHQGASAARAAAFIMHGQVEAGTLCPLTMTAAAQPILYREPALQALQPLLTSRSYDPSDAPVANKRGMLVGMGLTEKQGGSDLRRISTRAVPIDSEVEGTCRLMGHKWFMSVPTADAHLVLALLDDAPTCFYVPRRLSDGSLNAVRLVRLKDKLGNRSNASAEVEFQDAWGLRVGAPGRGIATLIEMAGYTRLDCALGSTALMRAALVQALHHARHRVVFDRVLWQQPLMRAVLADLALEVEAAVMLGMRLARAVGQGTQASMPDQALARILTPAAKFWVCKRAVAMVGEAMEVLGGNGYVETHVLARLYREAPVNSIWEGSGNVMCLDVLRAVERHVDLTQVLFDWLLAEADDANLRNRVTALRGLVSEPIEGLIPKARYLAATLVQLVQAVLLRRHGPQEVADAFIVTRLSADAVSGEQGVFGTGIAPGAQNRLLERAWSAEC